MKIAWGESVQREAYMKLIGAMDEILGDVGFKRSGSGDGDTWERRASWKTEEIRLGGRHPPGSPVNRFMPSVYVALPIKIDISDAEFHYVMHDNLERVVSPYPRSAQWIRVPEASWNVKHFVKRYAGFMAKALPWFKRFESPEMLAKELDQFVTAGSPIDVAARKFLKTCNRGPLIRPCKPSR